jgi:hypothetical protein
LGERGVARQRVTHTGSVSAREVKCGHTQDLCLQGRLNVDTHGLSAGEVKCGHTQGLCLQGTLNVDTHRVCVCGGR